LTDRIVQAQGGVKRVSEERKLSVDIKIDNMSPEQLIEMLSKKSQEYEK